MTCGTSYRNKGVQKLLDAIVDYMPSPPGHPRHQGCQPQDRRGGGRVIPDDDAPFSALAFKIMTDPYVGRLASSACIPAI